MTDSTIIEGEARDVTRGLEPTRALVPAGQSAVAPTKGAIFDLGEMSEADFRGRIITLSQGVQRIAELQRSLLKEGTDWGAIPGIDKPIMFKSGAERLAMFYHLVPQYQQTVTVDPQPSGIDRITVETSSLLHYGSHDGPIVGEGVGVASSWETRYRWRNSERVCPECKKAAIIKGKAQYGGGWLCWKRKDGCGRTWPDGSAVIEGQQVGKEENAEPHDLLNTLAKISKKRAMVDSVISTLGASALFSQDLEEGGEPDTGDPGPAGAAPRATPTSRGTAPRQASAGGAVPPAPPADGLYVGKLEKQPEGLRSVKRADSEAIEDKLELVFMVGRSRHTALLFGPLARATFERVAQGDILVGGLIRMDGRRVEVKWADDKPTKKEIHDPTFVDWATNGPHGLPVWTRITAAADPQAQMPLEDPPNRRPAHAARPVSDASSPVSTSTSAGSPQAGPLDDDDLWGPGEEDAMTLPVMRPASTEPPALGEEEPFEQRCAIIEAEQVQSRRGPLRRFWLKAQDLDEQTVRAEFLVLEDPNVKALDRGMVVRAWGEWRQTGNPARWVIVGVGITAA